MSPRIHCFVSGDNQWNERAGRVQDFLVIPLGLERLSFNIPRAVKNIETVPWNWECGELRGMVRP